MTGLVEDFTVAVDVEGQSEPVSTLMYLQERRPHHHFGCLVKNIEMMFETGKAPYPAERTMLTSGILDRALTSLSQAQKRLTTPELAIRYQPVDYPHAPNPDLNADPRTPEPSQGG